MPTPTRNSRQIAFQVLEKYRQTGEFVSQNLEQTCSEQEVSPADRRLISEMVYGVIKRQATLNSLLQLHLKKPHQQIEQELLTLLQLGAYQLVFLNAVPDHAALFETVEVARKIGKKRWVKFANGVLRAVSRNLTNKLCHQPTAHAIPLSDTTFRLAVNEPFPNPDDQFVNYFAAAFSFPRWLVKRWQRRWSCDQLIQIGFQLNQSAVLTLRINTLQTTRDDYLQTLLQAGFSGRAGTEPNAVLLEKPGVNVKQLPLFNEGAFVVQNESAMQAARILNPQPEEKLLDLCAAPGTKTTHLAELMQNRGEIFATDVDQQRLNKIKENVFRLKIEIIQTLLIDRQSTREIPAGPFDAILVDVPCSNTGVLHKRPEARWRLKPEDISELNEIQLRLLQAACQRLQPRGRILYSTCSIEPEENSLLVDNFLKAAPQMEQIHESEQLPCEHYDGAYTALLQQKS